ncbi:MAG: tetratricopeptide repeat protein [Acidobacteriota bacterium]|nr:tetratricopeptide repeat protein [Acidobacteriota bacterium]
MSADLFWVRLGIGAALLGLQIRAQEVDHLAQAKAYVERRMLTEAETEARKAIATQADPATGHYLLGYILFCETKARESLAEYTEGAKHRRPNAADLRIVGSDYVLLGAYADADKWFTKATGFDPVNVQGWYYLGRTKYNENRFEEAISAFNRCLDLAPKHVKAEDNIGLSLQALGRTDEALAAFRTAIAWQSNAQVKDPWPYIDMGSFLVETDRAEQAVPYLEQAINLRPDFPRPHQQLGKAFLSLRQLSRAQSELETAVNLAPGNASAHYVLGQLYQKQGQVEKAKREFARFSQLNAGRPAEENREFHSQP